MPRQSPAPGHGAGPMSLTWFTLDTPLPTGPMRVAVTAHGVAAAAYTPREAAALPPGPELCDPAEDRRVAKIRTHLGEYFAGRRRDMDLPIDWQLTTGIQRAVLRTLQQRIGFGQTVSYGRLAEISGAFGTGPERRALAARAVGSVTASNPVSLLVPCHRVVAGNGPGGFGGGAEGLAVKRWLLTLEGCLQPTLDWPVS